MELCEGNEISHIRMTTDELDAFLAIADKKGISYEQLWMNVITDNGTELVESFSCFHSDDPDFVCMKKCKKCILTKETLKCIK